MEMAGELGLVWPGSVSGRIRKCVRGRPDWRGAMGAGGRAMDVSGRAMDAPRWAVDASGPAMDASGRAMCTAERQYGR